MAEFPRLASLENENEHFRALVDIRECKFLYVI